MTATGEMSGELTKAQRELLVWIGQCPQGVIDISDESMVRRLVEKALVFKFFETVGSGLAPVWIITDAGRAVVSALENGPASLADAHSKSDPHPEPVKEG